MEQQISVCLYLCLSLKKKIKKNKKSPVSFSSDSVTVTWTGAQTYACLTINNLSGSFSFGWSAEGVF